MRGVRHKAVLLGPGAFHGSQGPAGEDVGDGKQREHRDEEDDRPVEGLVAEGGVSREGVDKSDAHAPGLLGALPGDGVVRALAGLGGGGEDLLDDVFQPLGRDLERGVADDGGGAVSAHVNDDSEHDLCALLARRVTDLG